MTQSFRLPDLGEGVHEAEILAVHVAVGQSIKEGDLILEVETDKAAVEIPSPITGTVSEILAKKGDMARVGDILINFAETADAVSAPAPEADSGNNSGSLRQRNRKQHRRRRRGKPTSRHLPRRRKVLQGNRCRPRRPPAVWPANSASICSWSPPPGPEGW